MSEVVGFVGLGRMGTPMSGHLIDAGFRVLGHDVDAGRMRLLEQAGGQACQSPRDVADGATVVITSLPDPAALREVVTGEDGLLHADDLRGLVVVETSTFALEDKERARHDLEAAGALVLDCPLSGTAAQAERKDLVVYASGDETAVRRCAPIFEGFGREHYYLGEFGSGTKMKFIANHLVSVHSAAAAEALVLAMKAGLDPATVHQVIGSGAGASRMWEVRGPVMVSGRYDQPGMPIHGFWKDLTLIGDFAKALGCPTPLFTTGTQLYLTAVAQGFGDHEVAAVCAALERVAGVARDV